MKRKVQIWSVIISGCIGFTACDVQPYEDPQETIRNFRGNTQGTTYEIIVADNEVNFTNAEIDSVLAAFDASLSTYIPTSKISQLNSSSEYLKITDETGFFKTCYLKSEEIFQLTNGSFDPSVFPLVRGWGFMDDVESPLSQEQVDSLLANIGFDKHHDIKFDGTAIELTKTNSGFQLDFNAIAQGYSVDVLGDFLDERGQKNYYIEIGGELLLSGKNLKGTSWGIGIDIPADKSSTHEIENVVSITNEAIATSGSYRKFYELDGKRYSHFLDPKTGYPVQHSLLSASVIARTCTEADAYATAFMVMGAEKTLKFVEQHPELNLKVYLLEDDGAEGYTRSMSQGFKTYLSAE
ncbi:MAG: FAD:protein FMN transferase [Crocinitomicaceae bacterium]|nr:FAD:protein FMN transferase [Crocinitomicaceae bacterium]